MPDNPFQLLHKFAASVVEKTVQVIAQNECHHSTSKELVVDDLLDKLSMGVHQQLVEAKALLEEYGLPSDEYYIRDKLRGFVLQRLQQSTLGINVTCTKSKEPMGPLTPWSRMVMDSRTLITDRLTYKGQYAPPVAIVIASIILWGVVMYVVYYTYNKRRKHQKGKKAIEIKDMKEAKEKLEKQLEQQQAVLDHNRNHTLHLYKDKMSMQQELAKLRIDNKMLLQQLELFDGWISDVQTTHINNSFT
jgi:hypothetical protein